MATVSSPLRKQLENTVREARAIADEAAADAVARLGIAAPEAPAYLSDKQKALRRQLRAHARSLGDTRNADGEMTTARLAEAAAYEHWHRMLFGRFLVERNLLIHPALGVPISRGDLKELAEEEGFADEWALVERFAAPSLPAVFKPDDPVLALELDPHFQARLRALVTALPEEIFAADDSLGWTYQFWRAAEKKAVNERQVKIGAAELPAVTQLFTEPYMVKFLLHNTLGAWWAGKVLAARPDLARDAPDENALRAACGLPGIEWEYLRFVRDPGEQAQTQALPLDGGGLGGGGAAAVSQSGRAAGSPSPPPSPIEGEGAGAWRPAAGTFPGWPQRAAEITYLDPCCGSGHFLVEAFGILAALRQEEEGLSPEEAARAVLRDNLHGLEIDGRCVQIAAFNVALAAWRLAGGPVSLPVPHIAWVGAPPPLPKAEFVALANGDAELQRGLAALHDLFRQAPLLGSLIELTGGDLVDPTRIARLDQSIAALVEKMRGAEPERTEGALAARGIADAAAILARHFTLQATNVPFLGRGVQQEALAAHLAERFDEGKADLATAMLERMVTLAAKRGTIAAVTPQNWLFLRSYKGLRKRLLETAELNVNVSLGPAAFRDMNWWAIQTALTAWTASSPQTNSKFLALDADTGRDLDAKPELMRSGAVRALGQAQQLRNPDHIIQLIVRSIDTTVGTFAYVRGGTTSGDSLLFRRFYWEIGLPSSAWALQQNSFSAGGAFLGRECVLLWENGHGLLASRTGGGGATIAGREAWNREGLAISYMRDLAVTPYTGEIFENVVCILIPRDQSHLPALRSFCESNTFVSAVRSVNRKLSVDVRYFEKAPFDLAYWQKVADEKYPNGLPEPYSDDPTQWLFHGHPRYAEAGTELHVALARLAGYCWPAESDAEMRLSAEARARIVEAATLPEADADGLLALVPALGERPLADRLRAYCTAAWGDAWTQGSEAALIAAACERANDRPPRQPTFDAWLRSHAARQHAKLFHDRPFLWWITDGRPDGFTAVANYHRLDRATLERLAYTMLGDWITRLGDDPRAEAAQILQAKLAHILEGEAPFDIFVRWKPLGCQPLGWDPDLDDGVRLNIRPFIEAGVLAHVPNVKYSPPDRGNDVASAPWYSIFNGKRRNDYHLSLAEKRAGRAKAAE